MSMVKGFSAIYEGKKKKKIFVRVLSYVLSFSLVFGDVSFAFSNNLEASQSLTTDNAGALKVDSGNSGNTELDRAQNGVPIVQIATPNAQGMSHNRFLDYNVGSRGQILNNSQNNGNSVLGGMINGNNNLQNSGSARTILNEVTSNSNSVLNGYIEQFGGNAALFIANPNGISCNGCGFIKTPRVNLITGNSNIEEGRIKEFSLSGRGEIFIGGKGVDLGEETDYFNIVTRVAKITGDIYGVKGDKSKKDVDIKILTGNDKYDVVQEEVSSKEKDRDEKRVAVDSYALGGMYAGRIKIIATEDGMGVNNEGVMYATAGDIEILSDGRIVNKGDIGSKGDIRIESKNEDIDIAGGHIVSKEGKIEIIAKRKIKIGDEKQETEIEVVNLEILAKKDVKLVSTGYEEEGLEEEGVSKEEEGVSKEEEEVSKEEKRVSKEEEGVSKRMEEINQLYSYAKKGAYVLAKEVKIESKADEVKIIGSSTTLNVQDEVIIEGDNVINSAVVKNQEVEKTLKKIEILAAGNILNEGRLESEELLLEGEGLENEGLLYVRGENLLLDKIRSIDNTGSIIAEERIIGDVEYVSNDGYIYSKKGINLNVENEIENEGAIRSKRDLLLEARSFVNMGRVFAEQNLNMSMIEGISNEGSILALNNIDLASNNLDNKGDIISNNQTIISVVAEIENEGAIRSKRDLLLDARSFVNMGRVFAEQNLKMSVINKVTNQGVISVSNNIKLDVQELSNEGGEILSEGNISVSDKISKVINKRLGDKKGVIYAKGFIDLVNDNIVMENQGGEVMSGSEIRLQSVENKAGGEIIAGGNIVIDGLNNEEGKIKGWGGVVINQVGIFNNREGLIKGYGDYSVVRVAGMSSINNENGRIESNNEVELDYEGDLYLGDESFVGVEALKLLDLSANNIYNRGEFDQGSDIELRAKLGNVVNSGKIRSHRVKKYLDENGEEYEEQEGNISLTAKHTVSNEFGGNIVATGFLDIESEVNVINQGLIQVGGDVSIEAGNDVDNRERGVIYSDGSLGIKARNAIYNREDSLIESGGDMYLGGVYDDESGEYKQNGLVNNYVGDIRSGGSLYVRSKVLNNLGRDYDLDARGYYGYNKYRAYLNSGGYDHHILSEEERVVSTLRTKQGEIRSGQNIDIRTGVLDNKGSILQANDDINIDGSVNNNTSSIVVNNLQKVYRAYYNKRVRCNKWSTSKNCISRREHDNRYGSYNTIIYSAETAQIKAVNGNLAITGNVSNNANKNINEAVRTVNTSFSLERNKKGFFVYKIKKTTTITDQETAVNGVFNDVVKEDRLNELLQDGGIGLGDDDIVGLNNNLYRINNENSKNSKNSKKEGRSGGKKINYLIESRLEFTDSKKYYGSMYFLRRAGIDVEDERVMMGDSYYEKKRFDREIRRLGMERSLMASNKTRSNMELMKKLYDNAAELLENMGMSDRVGEELSKEERDGLEKDVMWLVESDVLVNGRKYRVLAPKLYLSKQSKARIKDEEKVGIYAGNNIFLSGEEVASRDSNIVAGNNLMIRGKRVDLVNTDIRAGIKDKKARYQGRSILEETTAQKKRKANQEGTEKRGDVDIYGSEFVNISNLSRLDKEVEDALFSMIDGNGDEVINVVKKVGGRNVSEARISAGNNINVSSVGDIDLNVSDIRSGGGMSFISKKGDIENDSFFISSNGYLGFEAKEGSIKNTGSLESKASTVSLIAGGDIVSESLVRREGQGENYRDVIDNRASITGDNVVIKAGGDFRNMSADIEARESSYIKAEGDVEISSIVLESASRSGDSKNYTETYNLRNIGSKINIGTGDKKGHLVIESGGDVMVRGSDIEVSGSMDVETVGSFNVLSVKDISKSKTVSTQKRSRGRRDITWTSESESGINQSSNIKVGGDGKIRSKNNITIYGSNVEIAGEGKVLAKNKINVLSSVDYDRSYTSKEKEGFFGSDVGKSKKSREEENHNQKGSEIGSGDDLLLKSGGNMSVIASSLSSGGDMVMQAGEWEDDEGKIITNKNVGILIGGALDTKTVTEIDESTSFDSFDFKVERGRMSAGQNSNYHKVEESTTTGTYVGSSISVGGNLRMLSENDIDVVGSDVLVGGDANVESRDGNVSIVSGENTKEYKREEEEVNIRVSVGVGNAYVDAGYAADDLVKAGEAVKDARDNLVEMRKLQKEGKASQGAVDDAKMNVAMASANLVQAKVSMVLSAANAGKSGGSGGFYADAKVEMKGTKSTTTSSSVSNRESNFVVGGNTSIKGNNVTVKGSNLMSDEGDIEIDAKENVLIMASEDSSRMKESSEEINLSYSFGTNGNSFSGGYGNSSAKSNSTSYNNSFLGTGGKIKIKSGNDTKLSGANVEAGEVDLEVGNDLTIESKQNRSYSSNRGMSISLGGGSGGLSGGFSSSNGYSDRTWVDNQTSIIGRRSVSVKAEGNTHIKGGEIANKKVDGTDGGNLNISTGSLTYEDIKDSHYSKQQGSGVNIGGTSTISMTNKGSDKEGITRSTIGLGNIKIADQSKSGKIVRNRTGIFEVKTGEEELGQEITGLNREINKSQEIRSDKITGALDFEVSVDNRWFSKKGKNEMKEQLASLSKNVIKAAKDGIRMDTNILRGATAGLKGAGLEKAGESMQDFTNKYDAKTGAFLTAAYDNVRLNGKDSSYKDQKKINLGVVNGIETTQKDQETTDKMNGLTNYTPEEVQATAQKTVDDANANNADGHDGEVILYQNDGENAPEAFSYNGGEKATGGNGIKTTNINTAKTDLTDSGEVINKLYHETTNFEGHKENEVVAKRRGDYAQKVWEYNNAANGNVNTNTRTSADWNKEYKVLNNKTLAVGTVKSSILYHQDRENNNNYLEAGLEAASLTMGSVSLYKNLRNSKYKDAVIDAGGLILDTIGVLFPIVPGVASAGIQASRQGDGIINFIKGKVGKKKAERAEWQKTDIMDLTDSAEDIAKKHSIEKKAFQKKYKNNGGSGSSGNSPNKKKIVIGENMSERVIPVAKEIGGKYYKPRSKNPNNWIKNNKRWIKKEIKNSSDFYDVGIDKSRLGRSKFYKMEIDVLKNNNIKPKSIK